MNFLQFVCCRCKTVFNSVEDDKFRFSIFKENFYKIEKHNAIKTNTYSLGLTQFADLTPEEFAGLYLRELSSNFTPADPKGEMPNDSVDWRTKPGVVRPVKDQKLCGSFYAFSATGCIEATSKIFKSNEDQFSEQQLVDCS